jgi:hypothetical protein
VLSSKTTNRLSGYAALLALAAVLCVAPFVEKTQCIDIATGRLRTLYQLGPFVLSDRVHMTRFSVLAASVGQGGESSRWRTVSSSWFFGRFSGGYFRHGGVPGNLEAFVSLMEEPRNSPDTKRAAMESALTLLLNDDPGQLYDFLSELTRQSNIRQPWNVQSAMSKVRAKRL